MEGAIRASTVAFAGNSRADFWRFSNSRFQQSSVLQARIPSLRNFAGVTRIAGLAMAAPHFNENKPLRNLPPVINDVAGAAEIQRVLDHQSWSAQSADPVAYAPCIRK